MYLSLIHICANALKFQGTDYALKDVVEAAVHHARKASESGVTDKREVYVCLLYTSRCV